VGPHFAHREYVLTVRAEEHSFKHHLYAHRMRDAAGWLHSGEVAAYCKDSYYSLRTFAYVETMEPLSVHATSYQAVFLISNCWSKT
jgi:hypothetical protein